MKQKDIVIGQTYTTKVGEHQVRVVVMERRTDSFSNRARFLVRRLEEERVLPKTRAASALHECNPADWDPQNFDPRTRTVYARMADVLTALVFKGEGKRANDLSVEFNDLVSGGKTKKEAAEIVLEHIAAQDREEQARTQPDL